MPELLVTMIVSGVVFMAVMEGFGLFRRYAEGVAGTISENMELYDGYYLLGELVAGADSLVCRYGRADAYSSGVYAASIWVADSALVVRKGQVSDTLFRHASVEWTELDDDGHADSLTVNIARRDEVLVFGFRVNAPVGDLLRESVEETEKNYLYE